MASLAPPTVARPQRAQQTRQKKQCITPRQTLSIAAVAGLWVRRGKSRSTSTRKALTGPADWTINQCTAPTQAVPVLLLQSRGSEGGKPRSTSSHKALKAPAEEGRETPRAAVPKQHKMVDIQFKDYDNL